MTRPFRPVLPLLALLCATVALAACGSDAGSESGGGKSDEEQRLAFQDCLRDQGLDVAIGPRGSVAVRATPASGERGLRLEDNRRAFDTCRKKTGWAPPEPTEAQRREMQERALRFARCMREHGADVPDPAADGRMTIRVDRAGSAVFRRAQEACGSMMGDARIAAPAE